MSKIPVLLPGEPLPPYSYVPGKFPHPIRDPQGHSFGEVPDAVVNLDPQQWRECRPYLRGIDLFNHGFYWEAHESWEAVHERYAESFGIDPEPGRRFVEAMRASNG